MQFFRAFPRWLRLSRQRHFAYSSIIKIIPLNEKNAIKFLRFNSFILIIRIYLISNRICLFSIRIRLFSIRQTSVTLFQDCVYSRIRTAERNPNPRRKSKGKSRLFFAVGERSAEIFFVKFFNPGIDGETVRAVITEKRDAIGDFRPDALQRDEFFLSSAVESPSADKFVSPVVIAFATDGM